MIWRRPMSLALDDLKNKLILSLYQSLMRTFPLSNYLKKTKSLVILLEKSNCTMDGGGGVVLGGREGLCVCVGVWVVGWLVVKTRPRERLVWCGVASS